MCVEVDTCIFTHPTTKRSREEADWESKQKNNQQHFHWLYSLCIGKPSAFKCTPTKKGSPSDSCKCSLTAGFCCCEVYIHTGWTNSLLRKTAYDKPHIFWHIFRSVPSCMSLPQVLFWLPIKKISTFLRKVQFISTQRSFLIKVVKGKPVKNHTSGLSPWMVMIKYASVWIQIVLAGLSCKTAECF